MKNKILTLSLAVFLLGSTLIFTGCGTTKTSNSSTNTGTTQTAESTDSQNNPDSNAETSDDTVFSTLSTTDLSGNPIDSSIFKENKITLINAWNIGCTPCINELPELEKLNKEYETKGAGIKGLYFNFAEDISDDEMSQINDALSTAGVTYPQLRLTKEMYSSDIMQNVMAFPTTFVVDSNGKILDKIEGSNDYEGWKKVIEKYLAAVE